MASYYGAGSSVAECPTLQCVVTIINHGRCVRRVIRSRVCEGGGRREGAIWKGSVGSNACICNLQGT